MSFEFASRFTRPSNQSQIRTTKSSRRKCRQGLRFQALEIRQLLAAELTTTVLQSVSGKSAQNSSAFAALSAKNSLPPTVLNATVDFELFDGVTVPALPAGWTSTTTNANNWVTDNSVNPGSDTAPNHVFVANIGTVSDNRLTSPVFAASAANGRISFRHFYNTEATYDGGILEISVAGGAFTNITTAGGAFVSGGYTGPLSPDFQNPLGGSQAWNGNSNGYITTVVDIPTSAFGQNVQLRWRFGTDNEVTAVGWRVDTIRLSDIPNPPTLDFGDAPAPYPVTIAENGARHTVGALRLGVLADAEANGTHSATANADGNDEDGVTFPSGVDPGQTETVLVTASQSGGLLNAWIDWNVDGDWADVGEQVFTNTLLVAGTNSLNVTVPGNAVVGSSFARFRLSTTASPGVTGAASDGEVEDYQINIGQKRLVWVNRGEASDRFSETFGSNATIARGVVDAVFASWERVITNLNHSLFNGPGIINIVVSMAATGTGFGASAGVTSLQSGFPLSGVVTISRGNDTTSDGLGDGAGFFLDPTPMDYSEFQGAPTGGAFMGFATPGGPAAGLSDFFSLVNAEITHSLGLFSAPLRLNSPIDGTITNTNVLDFSEGGGVGTYYVFDGPSVTHLMTSNNGGSNGSSFSSAVHTAGKPGTGTNQPLNFTSSFRGNRNLVGTDDPGNAIYNFGQRTLVNDVLALIFKDAYNYSVTLPQTFGTTYAFIEEANSRLVIRGGLGSSNDVINVSRQGNEIVVSVNIGNDVAGTGPNGDASDLPAFVSRFPAAGITQITINAGDGNDTIIVQPQVDASIIINGGTQVTGDSLSFLIAGVTGINFTNSGGGTGVLTSSNRQTVSWSGIENVIPPLTDIAPPIVTGVFLARVGVNGWNANLIDAFDGGGNVIGVGNTIGIQLSPNQIVPNGSLNRIVVQFNEPVVGFNAGRFSLTGVNTPNHSANITVSYDSANNRGIIDLTGPITRDRLRIGVSDAVTDVAGNLLDGNQAGGAGGIFDLLFNILVGDGTLDGSVNGGDIPVFSPAFNTSFGQLAYNPLADWNSDGSVNGGDIPAFSPNFNQSLSGTPGAPSFSGNSVPMITSKQYAADVDAYFKITELRRRPRVVTRVPR